MNSPFDLIKAIKNPQQFIMNFIKQNNNPIINNLIQMAESGDKQGVENFARNYFKEQGQDFDEIMSNFK